MKDKCKIPHTKERWLRTPIESYEHKFGEEFNKRVYRNTGEFIDGKPIQEIQTNTYRRCDKCGYLEIDDICWGWRVCFNDNEWVGNNLN